VFVCFFLCVCVFVCFCGAVTLEEAFFVLGKFNSSTVTLEKANISYPAQLR